MKPQKEKIMSEASVLFWKKGYSETSMKDIAGACNFRPANIYNFFKNKEEILFEILLEEMTRIIDSISHIEHDRNSDPVSQLRELIRNHARLTLGHRRSSMLLFDVGLGNLSDQNKNVIISLRDDYDRILASIIERGIEKGLFEKTDVKMAVNSIASLITRTRIWFSDKGRLSVDDVIEFIINFSLKALK